MWHIFLGMLKNRYIYNIMMQFNKLKSNNINIIDNNKLKKLNLNLNILDMIKS